jgi:hydrogenase nickel incorporation protein HypA/HybF
MHELSIVMGIVDIAKQYADEASATIIDEIEMDIGCLSTVEMNAFEFAWCQGVKQTILEGSVKTINRVKGKAQCIDCDGIFPIENLYDACPICGKHLLIILEGKELRVKTLVVSGHRTG